ncbi:MAG: hypothetical protein J6B09_05950 [Clostridia bacterium]|nr:hypothetical protein [Clostridia bacterium]
MFIEISEQDFLSISKEPIQYIGIYELDWLLDDNLLDCEGMIVAFESKKILITSKEVGDDEFDFIYYDFLQDYDCRKIISSSDEPLSFIRKEVENTSRKLRFQIGDRPIIAIAYEKEFLTVGISHWGLCDEWLEFENDHLLNDRNPDN